MALSKRSPLVVRARERERQALELRKTGASYNSIAKHLGCSHGAAYNAVKRGLAHLESDIDINARELVKLELERIDRALVAIWQQVISGDLFAVDRFVRLSELRAKYLSLFAPERSQIEVTLDDIAGSRERLAQQLARIAAREGASEDTAVLN